MLNAELSTHRLLVAKLYNKQKYPVNSAGTKKLKSHPEFLNLVLLT